MYQQTWRTLRKNWLQRLLDSQVDYTISALNLTNRICFRFPIRRSDGWHRINRVAILRNDLLAQRFLGGRYGE